MRRPWLKEKSFLFVKKVREQGGKKGKEMKSFLLAAISTIDAFCYIYRMFQTTCILLLTKVHMIFNQREAALIFSFDLRKICFIPHYVHVILGLVALGESRILHKSTCILPTLLCRI